ncbi:MAG: hypothetical protein ACRD91_01970, partial [Nitrosopumilaceae archaeon]
MSEVKSAMENFFRANPVVEFYEDTDIVILINALLKKHNLGINTDCLVYPITPSNNIPANYSTYLLSPVGFGGEQNLAQLKETICIALLDENKNKQILLPYKIIGGAHWVTVHILITDQNIIKIRIHDSAGTYTSGKLEEDLKDFLEGSKIFSDFVSQEGERTKKILDNKKELIGIFFDDKNNNKIKFINCGRSDIFPIQSDEKGGVKNFYCGGYTARLMVQLTLNSGQEITEKSWGCDYNEDKYLRIVDAKQVTKYNPGKITSFGQKFAILGQALAYTKEKKNQDFTEEQIKETKNIFSKIEEALNKLDNDILGKIFEKMPDLEDVKEIKKRLIEIYQENKGKLSESNPLSFFFEIPEEEISEKSRLNGDILLVKLWNDFVLLLKKKLKIKDPEKKETNDKKDEAEKIINAEVAKKIFHKEWDFTLFNEFLKSMLIPTGQIDRIDYQLEKADFGSLKSALLDASNTLLTENKKHKILLVRNLGHELIIFRLYIEYYRPYCPKTKEQGKSESTTDQGKSDSTKEQEKLESKKEQEKPNTEKKRVIFEIFSNNFNKDIEIDLSKTRTWEKVIALIEYRKSTAKCSAALRELISSDFLKSDKID